MRVTLRWAELMLFLGLASAGAPALAMIQTTIQPGQTYPFTLYTGPLVYGMRIIPDQNMCSGNGFQALTVEITDQSGVVSTLEVYDDSSLVFNSRKIRVTNGPLVTTQAGGTVGDGCAFYDVNIYTNPGELAQVTPAPPLPVTTGPYDVRGWSSSSGNLNKYPYGQPPGVLLDGGTVLTSTSCRLPVIDYTTGSTFTPYKSPSPPIPPLLSDGGIPYDYQNYNTVARYDGVLALGEAPFIQGRHVNVVVNGRNSTDTADATLTGSGALKVYWTDLVTPLDGGVYNAPGWAPVKALEQTIATGEAQFAAQYTLDIPGWYCFVPSAATGADKIRERVLYTVEPRH